MVNRRRLLATGLAIAISFAAGLGAERTLQLTEPHPSSFALISQAWQLLHEEYVDPAHMDPVAMAHAAIAGMADALGDRGHTYYLDPEEAAQQADADEGSSVGIGMLLDDAADPWRITALVPGGPASRAGLQPGDRILAVDGRSTSRDAGGELWAALSGSTCTTVGLTVGRQGRGRVDPFDVRLTREQLEWPAVIWAMVPARPIAHIWLETFQEGAAADLREAVQEAAEAGATGVILDLRDDGGGFLDEVLKAAGVFLPVGSTVLREVDRNGAEVIDVVPDVTAPVDLPLVVLVDFHTVSAPEVFAAALMDAGRATVVGERTYGTGPIMTDHWLADDSDLLIGVTEWRSPAGRSTWRAGLLPDVTVSRAEGSLRVTPDRLPALGPKGLKASGDTQLLRAIDLLTGGPGG